MDETKSKELLEHLRKLTDSQAMWKNPSSISFPFPAHMGKPRIRHTYAKNFWRVLEMHLKSIIVFLPSLSQKTNSNMLGEAYQLLCNKKLL